MIQMVAIIVAIISLIISFFAHPVWAWIPVILADVVICIAMLAAKQKYKFKFIPELSPEANDLLQLDGHYFVMPFASKDFSASAATFQFTGIIIAVVGLFRGFWWAIALATANWFVMGFIAVSLSPVSLLVESTTLQIAHDEVVEYINSQRSQE